MKELIESVMAHLLSAGPVFTWWQIYATWGLVGTIFIVDNVLRLKYNRKLLEKHNTKMTEIDQRMNAAQFEIRRHKYQIHCDELRNGVQGSILDIQDYKTKVRSISFNSNSEKLDIGTDFKYGVPEYNNYPTLGD